MEIKESTTKSSQEDHVVCSNNINGDISQETRFYTCSFCNRGFSNAQALGGHMNVHRKDRARLQESLLIQENLIATETTSKGSMKNLIDSNDDQLIAAAHELSDDDDEYDQGHVPKRRAPWIIFSPDQENSDHGGRPGKKDDDDIVNNNFEKISTLELSLCIEPSSTTSHDSARIRSNNMIPSSKSSSPTEVDLELRLATWSS